ncbi:3-hydroxyacyl-ACP dehydratase FabZ [Aquella oligotrophica]|uniref:3-hydroxyacyl-[acyl-carrier-protein] dehydratase FabZ n=1 Tax=Aquella oligotrophica TaxID=2067065 RepID=A0A2I7N7W4_9NEIS|nr:3-hydroxyacyl-ACP dehydratase FabZ [Aquella oligotrophica]AUR52559.1 3-hydroxyacyl-[acyl-carrier-protein] dehydratase FabZ [Aquella oligotrophica]
MSENTSTELNILEIMKWLPHRYPLLLVDKVISHDGAKHIKALKNVTMNEEFFTGHFPGFPVMPGVLMIEAMAQVSGILFGLIYGMQKENEQSFFASIDKARFKRQVIPGDQLIFDIELLKVTRGIAKFQAVATVEGQVAAEAEIMIARREV